MIADRSFPAAVLLCILLPFAFGIGAEPRRAAAEPAGSDLAPVKSSVGEIVARGTGFESRGTGILVGDPFGVLTNLHVITKAREISIIPEGRTAAIALRVDRAWPELDLAFLRAAGGDGEFRAAGMRPMPVAAGAVDPGLEVFSIGYPRGLGYSISRGIVSGLRTFGELPEDFRSGWDLDPRSRWLQTDCPINPGNSGGPLVNSAGQLVGINTWSSRVDNDIYFALLAADAIAALERPAPAAADPAVEAPGREPTEPTIRDGGRFVRIPMPGPVPSSPGYIQLDASPGCDLVINGQRICSTPMDGATMVISNLETERDLYLQLLKPGFASGWATATIPREGVTTSTIRIGEPLPTELAISTVPTDCELSLEGPTSGTVEKREATRRFVGLPPGTYEVTARLDGRSVKATIALQAALPLAITMDLLEPRTGVRNLRDPIRVRIEYPRSPDIDWLVDVKMRPKPSSEWKQVPALTEGWLAELLKSCGSRESPVAPFTFRMLAVLRGKEWTLRHVDSAASDDVATAQFCAEIFRGGSGSWNSIDFFRRLAIAVDGTNAFVGESVVPFEVLVDPGWFRVSAPHVSGGPGPSGQGRLVPGHLAPVFTLKDADGQEVSLESLEGSVVVIEFWATWCGPCKRGLPFINEFATWAAASGKPIKVFAINTIEDGDAADRPRKAGDWWKENKMGFPCLMDLDDKVFEAYGFAGIPATVVIGPDGTIIGIRTGIDPRNPGVIVDDLKATALAALGDTAPEASPKAP